MTPAVEAVFSAGVQRAAAFAANKSGYGLKRAPAGRTEGPITQVMQILFAVSAGFRQ